MPVLRFTKAWTITYEYLNPVSPKTRGPTCHVQGNPLVFTAPSVPGFKGTGLSLASSQRAGRKPTTIQPLRQASPDVNPTASLHTGVKDRHRHIGQAEIRCRSIKAGVARRESNDRRSIRVIPLPPCGLLPPPSQFRTLGL